MPTIRMFVGACAALAIDCTLGAYSTAPAPVADAVAAKPWCAGTSSIAD